MSNVVVLTGAGISAESGIKTFRDADGLWEGHDVMEVASPEGWARNQDLVLNFYNQRRKQLKAVKPNAAHYALRRLDSTYDTTIVTQNVDNLHERAGSENIIHLHGELTKARSLGDPSYVIDWESELTSEHKCPNGSQLRPHIVWFGEPVPMLEMAIEKMITADIVIIIGTSMQVYPAASLTAYTKETTPIYYVDPHPRLNTELLRQLSRLTIIEKTAVQGVPLLVENLLRKKLE